MHNPISKQFIEEIINENVLDNLKNITLNTGNAIGASTTGVGKAAGEELDSQMKAHPKIVNVLNVGKPVTDAAINMGQKTREEIKHIIDAVKDVGTKAGIGAAAIVGTLGLGKAAHALYKYNNSSTSDCSKIDDEDDRKKCELDAIYKTMKAHVNRETDDVDKDDN